MRFLSVGLKALGLDAPPASAPAGGGEAGLDPRPREALGGLVAAEDPPTRPEAAPRARADLAATSDPPARPATAPAAAPGADPAPPASSASLPGLALRAPSGGGAPLLRVALRPCVVLTENLLSPAECAAAVAAAAPRLEPSKVAGGGTTRNRTSSSYFFIGAAAREAAAVMLEARMRGLLAAAAAAVGRPALELGEATQVVRYREGQFYALHCESSCVFGRPVEAENVLETNHPSDQPTNQPTTTH
jgi:hypothetical protein